MITRDRIHPSESGCKKVTALLMNLLKTDTGASRWFLPWMPAPWCRSRLVAPAPRR